jgi:hypothetical protein
MSDLIQSLKSETGLEDKQVEGGLGALFDYLQAQLPPDVFKLVQQAIPQAENLIHGLKSGEGGAAGQGGGLLSSVAELAGKLLGGKGGDLADLLGNLSKVGLSLDQAKEFLPKAIAMIRQILPDDVFQKILASLPALAEMVMGQAGKPASNP